MKPIDKRLKTLDEHIQNAEMYLRHRDIYSKLSRQYAALKDEVKEVEQIRKGVYNMLRQEQREQQPRRTQDMER